LRFSSIARTIGPVNGIGFSFISPPPSRSRARPRKFIQVALDVPDRQTHPGHEIFGMSDSDPHHRNPVRRQQDVGIKDAPQTPQRNNLPGRRRRHLIIHNRYPRLLAGRWRVFIGRGAPDIPPDGVRLVLGQYGAVFYVRDFRTQRPAGLAHHVPGHPQLLGKLSFSDHKRPLQEISVV
jgi:hypothetical protein